jgi:hypothetical protein
LTLREILAAAADDAGIIARDDPDGTVSWTARERRFAVLEPTGSTAWFRLDAVLAGAALRTPSTMVSDRGPEWVGFSPDALDDHDRDRATAWFVAALRRASA